MSEDEIFEIPKPKKERKKKVLTEERKEQLREQLKKAREVRRMNKSKLNSSNLVVPKERKTKKKVTPKNDAKSINIDVSEKMETETIIESDTEPQTTTEDVNLEDLGNEEQEILNIQLDIEEMNNKLNKKKKRTVQQKKGVIIKQRQTINDIVEKKVNERFAKLNSVVQEEVNRRKPKPAPVKAPTPAPVKVQPAPTPAPPPVPVKAPPVGFKTPFWA